MTILECSKHTSDVRLLAYILATFYLETGKTFQAIKEIGSDAYFFNRYDPKGKKPHIAKSLGNTCAGDGVLFPGMGHVQLTGRRNYVFQSKKHGIDLIGNPHLMLKNEISIPVSVQGMLDGDYTSRPLSRYINKDKCDFNNSRRVVNGTDRAEDIAAYAEKFLSAIKSALLQIEPVAIISKQEALPKSKKAHVIDPMTSTVPNSTTIETISIRGEDIDNDEYLAYQLNQATKQHAALMATIEKPEYQSKTIIAAVAMLLSLMLTRFGLNISPETALNIITLVVTIGLPIIIALRKWSKNKPIKKRKSRKEVIF